MMHLHCGGNFYPGVIYIDGELVFLFDYSKDCIKAIFGYPNLMNFTAMFFQKKQKVLQLKIACLILMFDQYDLLDR